MRILWIKTELLHPVNKGGRIRTYQMLRALKNQHHITYVALHGVSANDPALEQAKEVRQHRRAYSARAAHALAAEILV